MYVYECVHMFFLLIYTWHFLTNATIMETVWRPDLRFPILIQYDLVPRVPRYVLNPYLNLAICIGDNE